MYHQLMSAYLEVNSFSRFLIFFRFFISVGSTATMPPFVPKIIMVQLFTNNLVVKFKMKGSKRGSAILQLNKVGELQDICFAQI